MTIDEAIKHAEEVAIQQIEKANALDNIPLFGMSKDDIEEIKECYKCSKEHEQLAEWLKELQAHREAWEKVTGIISKWKDGVGGVVVSKDAFSDILDLINDFRPKEGDAE